MKGFKFSDNPVGKAVDKKMQSGGSDPYGGLNGVIAKLGNGGNVQGQANQKEKG